MELVLEEVEGGVQSTKDVEIEHPVPEVEKEKAPDVDVRSYRLLR